MLETSETIANCPSCRSPMNVSAVPPFSNVNCPSCGIQSRVKLEFGPYTLVRRYAQGGMSMVFLAKDNTLDREVALKILSEEFSTDERRIAAFEEEARITASFSHPNVVQVLTTGKAFGRLYIAMEFVPGGHFEQHINERGKIPQTEMLALAIEVAEGLKAAHAAGLIHRDVKPGNILLDAEGHAKIVDFGLALVTKGGKAQATEIWATPYYVPPETIEGHREDFRSDIYAFGATLYHALAGRPSCAEQSMSTPLLREAKKNVVPLGIAEPSLCDDLCQIVDKAMAHQPVDRFSSYDELIRRLQTVLKHLQSGAPGAMESSGHAARRRVLKKRREIITLGAAVLAVLVAAAGGISWVIHREAPQPEQSVQTNTAPTVQEPNTTAAAISATKIARSYRDARAAVEARDFAKAAEELVKLRENPAVQEPTRTWAGVEAVAAAFLDGKSSLARRIARDTAAHAQAVTGAPRRVDGELVRILNHLPQFKPIPPNKARGDDAAWLMGAMISGLKHWEQGLTARAVGNFKTVTSVELGANDQWLAIHQNLAADYLADARLLSAPVLVELPATAAACEAAVTQLDTLHSRLKTRGRARFNVRAWQLDLKRHAKILEAQQTTPAPADEPPAVGNWDTGAVMSKLTEFAAECEFAEASAYLKDLRSDQTATRHSLLAVAEAAALFLSDLGRDLRQTTAYGEFLLKSGESVNRVWMDEAGVIVVDAAAVSLRAVKWADFSPDALIAMHRIFVKNSATEVERLRRHECAVSYDWLAGNRGRALTAAAVLSQSSSAFKQRWDTIASGLPE